MVDSVLGVVSVVFFFVENTRRCVQLKLQLGGQSTFEVDSPQGLSLTDGHTFNLIRKFF